MEVTIFTWLGTQLMELLKRNFSNQKERFSQVFTPLYESLAEVHANYTRLFNTVKNMLPTHHVSDGITPVHYYYSSDTVIINDTFEQPAGTIGDKSYWERIIKCRQILEEGRIDKISERVFVREFSSRALHNFTNDLELKFMWSVFNYFLNSKNQSTSIRYPDSTEYSVDVEWIKRYLKEDNLESYSDSPSSYLMKIFSSNDAEEIRKEIIRLQSDLNAYFNEATICYSDLKIDAFK